MKNIRIHLANSFLKMLFPKELSKAQAIVILPIVAIEQLGNSRGRVSANFSAVQSIKVNLPCRPAPTVLFAEFHNPIPFNCNYKY